MCIVIRALISEDSGQANLVHTSTPLYDMLTFMNMCKKEDHAGRYTSMCTNYTAFIEYVQVYMQVLFLILNVMDLR